MITDKVYQFLKLECVNQTKKFLNMSSKNKLIPEETVFIDDSIQHVKAAGECGINAS